jgi:hypothetical protein
VRPETRTVGVALVPLWVTPPVDEVQVAPYAEMAEPLVAPAVMLRSTHDVAVPTV